MGSKRDNSSSVLALVCVPFCMCVCVRVLQKGLQIYVKYRKLRNCDHFDRGRRRHVMSCGHTSASVLSLSEKCNLLAHTTRMLHSMLFGRALESAFARALDRSSQHSTVYVASLWHRPSQLGRPTGRADWPGSECKCWCVAAAAAAAACTFSECALVQELPRFGLNMRSIGRGARALMVSHTHTLTHGPVRIYSCTRMHID